MGCIRIVLMSKPAKTVSSVKAKYPKTDIRINKMKHSKLVEAQLTEARNYLCRAELKKLFISMTIFLGLALVGCDTHKVDASAESNKKKENNMESLQNTTTLKNKIPPIDAEVLTNTKTATFAMG